MKTHWKILINPDYIGAYLLPPGEDLVVTIQSVGMERVTGTGGKKDDYSVARLVGQKPFILNATNSKTIAKLYGPYVEDWAGKKIRLYASTTMLAGEIVECLRVRPVVPGEAGNKPGLADGRFQSALEKVQEGSYPAADLSGKFTLTTVQQAALAAVVETLQC